MLISEATSSKSTYSDLMTVGSGSPFMEYADATHTLPSSVSLAWAMKMLFLF